MSRTPNHSAPNKRYGPLPRDRIARYREFIIRRHDARSSVKANGYFDKLMALRREIHTVGEAESRRILTLLDDPHPAVREWAAFDALSLDPDAGVRVLRELAAGPPSPVQGDAKRTLELYFEGNMDLQPWKTED